MSENLQIKCIDLHPLHNAKEHFTDKFELIHGEKPVPILRRGQKFLMTIWFENRNFKLNEDAARIIFSYGNKPNEEEGTKKILPLQNITQNLENSEFWALKINCVSEEENNFYMQLEVISPPDCPVGIWNLKMETYDACLTTKPTVYEYESDIYFLFNPWCSGDQVYMKDKIKLGEYVLNDIGKIWLGPKISCKGREWIFGQFDACVLPAVMLMFSRSNIADKNRGDPIITTRTISKLVNSDDGNGILTGRWDGVYYDGIPPAAWTGSVDILQQFLDTKQSVKYGQCWIFAGVVTTISRALGIPSRVVSNLISAHDANQSLTVDKYYDKNNEELNYDYCTRYSICEESIWNYHVWNDVWMARPDLKGFHGWQALDATPTKQSHGFEECGPASLEAIKKGVVGLNFDVGFILSSVNADIIRWKEDSSCDSGFSKINCNKNKIGCLILTKFPHCYDPNGGKDKEDITFEYKNREGTKNERHALKFAKKVSEIPQIYYDEPDCIQNNTEFSLKTIKCIKIGESFSITVNIQNKSDKHRNFKGVLCARSTFYNGVKAKEIIKVKDSFRVLPKSSEKVSIEVKSEDYVDKLVEYGIIKFVAVFTDMETNTTWVDEDDFQVEKPSIVIQVPGDLELDKESLITLSFKNPLKKTLTNCKFYVAVPLWLKNIQITSEDIQPEAEGIARVTIKPSIAGIRKMVATFTSTELIDITGSVELCI